MFIYPSIYGWIWAYIEFNLINQISKLHPYVNSDIKRNKKWKNIFLYVLVSAWEETPLEVFQSEYFIWIWFFLRPYWTRYEMLSILWVRDTSHMEAFLWRVKSAANVQCCPPSRHSMKRDSPSKLCKRTPSDPEAIFVTLPERNRLKGLSFLLCKLVDSLK